MCTKVAVQRQSSIIIIIIIMERCSHIVLHLQIEISGTPPPPPLPSNIKAVRQMASTS